MTFAEDIRKTVSSARSIPGELGLREHTVRMRRSLWSGDYTGDGTTQDQFVEAIEGEHPPRVRWLTDGQRALGEHAEGSVEIGPMTPEFVGGGIDFGALIGSALDKGEQLEVLITGPRHPSGGTYRITKARYQSALSYYLICEPSK
jgi:hypothetical protein